MVRNTVNLGAQKAAVEALSGSFSFGFGFPNLESPFHISCKGVDVFCITYAA